MSGATIKPMTAAELDVACEVIGLAFADNPSTLANVRGDRTKARSMMRRAVRIAKLDRPFSSVLVAHDHGQVVGVLNAVPWPQCQLGWSEKFKTAPSMIRIMGCALASTLKMTNARARHDPPRPHWHIGPIGVHPDHQGHGIGTSLLACLAEMVDEHAMPAFLETDVDRNVVLYERFGFQVVADADIIGINTRFMWRDPQTGAEAPPSPGANSDDATGQ
jgi:ribosomal protein S18 acetylase RimI-like enzyme